MPLVKNFSIGITTALFITIAEQSTSNTWVTSMVIRLLCTRYPEPNPAKKYVEYMGGIEAMYRKALEDFNKGEYRWVAELLNHAVSVEPEHQASRSLLADTYEQLGYQSESAPWRNFYLCGAKN